MVRNTRDALLEAFDAADGTFSTPHRNTTTTATQALLLINGDWTLARAKALATRLEHLQRSANDDQNQIGLAYRLALGRQPEPEEIDGGQAFINQQAKLARVMHQRLNTKGDHDRTR